MEKTKELYVAHFYNKKALKFLETFGFIIYYSKKAKYAYLYVIDNETENLIPKLKKHKSIKFVEKSLLFDDVLGITNAEAS